MFLYLYLLVPILAILISVIFLDEIFTTNLLVATILVSLGVIISIVKRKTNQNI